MCEDGQLKIAISANDNWEGKLTFDYPRHTEIMNLPIDYPRINQFPEWFVVEKNRIYQLLSNKSMIVRSYSGTDLVTGIQIKLLKGEKVLVRIITK